MNTWDENKKNLDIILKKGDLFDAISLREGVALRKHAFLKYNILFLSRILYGGVLIWEKIKQYLAPVEKVREAQEQLRKSLGVKVDFVSFKWTENYSIKEIKENKFLSILYLEDDIEMSVYISNLEKILNFSEIYHLDKIYLRLSDITDYFASVNLDSFKVVTLKKVAGGYLDSSMNEYLLCLSHADLRELIKRLKSVEISKEYIFGLGEKITDLVIKNAINEFDLDDDLEKLQDTVTRRLNLLLNSDNSQKDKVNGKVFDTVSLNEELVKVVTMTQKGEVVDNKTMTLYKYLEVEDYQDLARSVHYFSDAKNLRLVAMLYLYLWQNNNISQLDRNETLSFYDKIYKRFTAKRNKKVKKIVGIHSKSFKCCWSLVQFVCSSFFSAVLLLIMVTGGLSIDLINHFCFSNSDTTVLENMINTVILPYKYSYELESKLLGGSVEKASEGLSSILDVLGVQVGDTSNNDDEKIVALVKNFNEALEIPTYYATSYAVDATYSEGAVTYSLTNPETLVFEDVEPLFEVTHFLSRTTLEKLKNNHSLDLFNTFYPVGDNYVLTDIRIKDMNSNKEFYIYYDKIENCTLNDKELEFLLSMERPQITYTYGISRTQENALVKNAQNNEFYTGGKSDIKEAIIKGLGLNSDASLQEILTAIKSKDYSKTPIKDAGLTDYIKNLNENEYFETIASLDSLVCNLAASLAVESTDDFMYVVGYANNGDGHLSSSEGHAWAMDTSGNIIDTTPLSLEEENIIQMIFAWGVQNNIHVYAIMTLIALVIKKVFGKKVTLSLKVIKLKKLLNDQYLYEAYAKIDDILYGGLNVPRKVPMNVFVDKIKEDFLGFSKEELKELYGKLQQETDDRKVVSCAKRIVKEVPQIIGNEEVMKRVLEKQN